MNFQFYSEKLRNSEIFKSFIKENPKAYFCSAFFTIDKVGSDNQKHIDFYIPNSNQIFSFKLDSGKDIEKILAERLEKKIPLKINRNSDFDFGVVEDLISEEMEKQGIKNKIQKILISFQNVEKDLFLVCTVFVSSLGIIRINVDVGKEMPKVTLFEKKSFFDILRKA